MKMPYTITYNLGSSGIALAGQVTVPHPFRNKWCIRRVL